jgi:hypothetical protein
VSGRRRVRRVLARRRWRSQGRRWKVARRRRRTRTRRRTRRRRRERRGGIVWFGMKAGVFRMTPVVAKRRDDEGGGNRAAV